MDEILKVLTEKDDKRAYAKTREIAAASELTPDYYAYLERFASLLGNGKSYIRTRAFILCCSQARWDREGRIERILPGMLALLHDEKPTVVRQCLNAIKELVVFLPELKERIRAEVLKIDPGSYKDSMAPLIQKDVDELLELLDEGQKSGLENPSTNP